MFKIVGAFKQANKHKTTKQPIKNPFHYIFTCSNQTVKIWTKLFCEGYLL